MRDRDIARIKTQILELFDEMMDALEEKEDQLRGLMREADEKIKKLGIARAVIDEKRENQFESDPRYRIILTEKRRGKSPREIALENNMHLGEVELIYNLIGTQEGDFV